MGCQSTSVRVGFLTTIWNLHYLIENKNTSSEQQQQYNNTLPEQIATKITIHNGEIPHGHQFWSLEKSISSEKQQVDPWVSSMQT